MRSDKGVGLIELLVVMSLLTLALAMFGLAFSAMLRTSDASRDMGAVTDQARVALNLLDRQIRFGYWIKTAQVDCATTCEAIQVFTKSAGGENQCWVWAVDDSTGKLLSYHYSPDQGRQAIPPLRTFGTNQGYQGDWHVAAGAEGGDTDEVKIGAESQLSVIESSRVKPLDVVSLNRVADGYYVSSYAKLVIQKAARPDVTLEMTMSIRNQWIGAQYAGRCGG